MSYWQVLGIEPTADLRVLKRAYAIQLKQHKPERDPEGYRRVRSAYDAALQSLAARSSRPQLRTTSVIEAAPQQSTRDIPSSQRLENTQQLEDTPVCEHEHSGSPRTDPQESITNSQRGYKLASQLKEQLDGQTDRQAAAKLGDFLEATWNEALATRQVLEGEVLDLLDSKIDESFPLEFALVASAAYDWDQRFTDHDPWKRARLRVQHQIHRSTLVQEIYSNAQRCDQENSVESSDIAASLLVGKLDREKHKRTLKKSEVLEAVSSYLDRLDALGKGFTESLLPKGKAAWWRKECLKYYATLTDAIALWVLINSILVMALARASEWLGLTSLTNLDSYWVWLFILTLSSTLLYPAIRGMEIVASKGIENRKVPEPEWVHAFLDSAIDKWDALQKFRKRGLTALISTTALCVLLLSANFQTWTTFEVFWISAISIFFFCHHRNGYFTLAAVCLGYWAIYIGEITFFHYDFLYSPSYGRVVANWTLTACVVVCAHVAYSEILDRLEARENNPNFIGYWHWLLGYSPWMLVCVLPSYGLHILNQSWLG